MSRTTTTPLLYDPDVSANERQSTDSDQSTAFRAGEFPVAVYGLGKMGLPLASVYAENCGNVIGADVDETVVESINAGESHVKREPGLDELVAELVGDDALRAVSEPAEAAEQASLHVVIVPTLLTDDHTPDLSILQSVVDDIASGLSRGDMVVVESTVPPRTCSDVVYPRLQQKSGLSAGEFGLAFCPERTSSGRALEDIRGAYPKVVGGIDDESTRVATLIYEELNDSGTIPVSDTTTAEAVKVFEGVYRDVNIALANELAQMTDELGIDVTEAITVANTQPFCNIHDPGPGVGGHCIPYYPYFLIDGLDSWNRLLKTAREINDEMPAFTVRKLAEELAVVGKNVADAKVAVLGLTYRPGVEEIRASPAIPITDRLVELGADVRTIDPMLDETSEFGGEQIPLEELYKHEFDAVVLVTDHEEFGAIDWEAFENSLVVIDGQRALDLSGTDHRVYALGAGNPGNTGTSRSDRPAEYTEPGSAGGDDRSTADGAVGTELPDES